MIFLAMALASGAMQPLQVGKDVASWIRDEDYANFTSKRGEEKYVRFRLLVSPAGNVDRCDILISSGSEQMDAGTCAAMLARANFTPARDEQGNPAFATFERSVSLARNARKNKEIPADIELSLSALPAQKPGPLRANYLVMVDATGSIRACQPQVPEEFPVLQTLACQQVRTNWKAIPATNSEGHPVPSLQTLSVKFSAQHPAHPNTKN